MIIKDPAIDPYIIKSDGKTFDVYKYHISETDKKYETSEGYFVSLENACDRIRNLMTAEQLDVVDFTTFLETYQRITEGVRIVFIKYSQSNALAVDGERMRGVSVILGSGGDGQMSNIFRERFLNPEAYKDEEGVMQQPFIPAHVKEDYQIHREESIALIVDQKTAKRLEEEGFKSLGQVRTGSIEIPENVDVPDLQGKGGTPIKIDMDKVWFHGRVKTTAAEDEEE